MRSSQPVAAHICHHSPSPGGCRRVSSLLSSARWADVVTRRAYELLGASDRVAIDVFEGGHSWHGTLSLEWLDKWLRA